jgi:hypothetical protein
VVERQCEIHKREPRGDELRILDAQPRLDPLEHEQVMLVLDCWFTCSADRALGFGAVGDIPTLAIRAWAAAEAEGGLDREATKLLVSTIRYVDNWRAQREADKRRLEEA